MSAAEQIFGAGGKRMRPALVFLVSRATAELIGLKCVISHILSQNSLSYICWINVSLLYHRELTMQHRRLAEIIEMIHTASLIHDDVLDDSDIRRGKILSWKSLPIHLNASLSLIWTLAIRYGIGLKFQHVFAFHAVKHTHDFKFPYVLFV